MGDASKPIIVAIDGPSGTGKSTTARLVAQSLGFLYLDTGAIYRAFTWKALRETIPPQDTPALSRLVNNINIGFDEKNRVTVDGVDRSSEIRDPQVSEWVSRYCVNGEVRSILSGLQRCIAFHRDCVLDGRDIGTVVFPQADFKFFLTADYKVRAERRFAELTSQGIKITLQEVEDNLRERDALDAGRELAPLRKAPDAVEIDTTNLSIQEQVELVRTRVSVVVAERMGLPQPGMKNVNT